MPDAACPESFEQIVERGSRTRDRRRPGLALDRRARLEQRTRVARVLGRDAHRDCLLALEAGAGIETDALRSGMELLAAPRAAPFRARRRRNRQLLPAAAAADDF